MPPSRSGQWILPPPWAAVAAALGEGQIHGPSLGGGIMYHCQPIPGKRFTKRCL
jgi:hypothetical protein